MSNYTVVSLFPQPFFAVDLSEHITEEHTQYLRSLSMHNNVNNLKSDNMYVLNEEVLSDLYDVIHNYLEIYSREVMGLDKEQQIYITQSWTLINSPGCGMHTHSHSNSIVSGSLYFDDLPEPSSNMVFVRNPEHEYYRLNVVKNTEFSSASASVTPKPNALFLFPSDLSHYVEDNKSNVIRRSLAFNTFVRGRIGNYKDATELFLK
jgi:uncharacterized protein (TIGR02466 family)